MNRRAFLESTVLGTLVGKWLPGMTKTLPKHQYVCVGMTGQREPSAWTVTYRFEKYLPTTCLNPLGKTFTISPFEDGGDWTPLALSLPKPNAPQT